MTGLLRGSMVGSVLVFEGSKRLLVEKGVRCQQSKENGA